MGVAVRNEAANVNANINVTPMVDVMLVLRGTAAYFWGRTKSR